MKQINFVATVMLVLLFTSCGSKTKHVITETGRPTLAEEEFTTYSVDNEYSVSLPSFLKKQNTDPDRYSLTYYTTNVESLDDISYWGVFIESDTKEAYEARRTKDGNLDKYPFTLKGLIDVAMETGDSKTGDLTLIGSPVEATINEMPALAQSYKMTIDIKVAKVPTLGYMMQIQGRNGKIYRINVTYPVTEVENETDVPEWVIETCNSFKIL